jgi:hypothetical protein
LRRVWRCRRFRFQPARQDEGVEGEAITNKQAFQALGTTLEAIKSQTPTEQMLTLAKGFENIKSEAAKTAILIQLFGKSGADLAAVLQPRCGWDQKD